MFNKLLALAIDEVLLTNWSGLRTGIVSVTIAPPSTGSRRERGRGGREGGREGGTEDEPQRASLRFAGGAGSCLLPSQGHRPWAAPPALQLQPPDSLSPYRYPTLHGCATELLRVHWRISERFPGGFAPELFPTDFLALEDLVWFFFFIFFFFVPFHAPFLSNWL